MGRRMRHIIALLLISAAHSTQAATVTLDTTAFMNGARDQSPGVQDQKIQSEIDPQPFLSATASVSDSGDQATGSANSFASANIFTGELKLRTSSDILLEPGVSAGPEVGGYAAARITESFLLNGTGTFTASMLFDVSWGTLSTWQAQGQVQIGAVTAFDSVLFDSTNSGSSGAVDDRLVSASVACTNCSNVSVNVSWFGLVQKLGGNGGGFVDASNTGTIWFEGTGGLLAAPSNANFLSDAAYPDDLANTTVVPLPATGVLLMGALWALALVGKRLTGRARLEV